MVIYKKYFKVGLKSGVVKWHLKLEKTLISYDPHAPRELRVNVAAQSIDDFYTAFNIKPGDGMWLDPENEYIFGNLKRKNILS